MNCSPFTMKKQKSQGFFFKMMSQITKSPINEIKKSYYANSSKLSPAKKEKSCLKNQEKQSQKSSFNQSVRASKNINKKEESKDSEMKKFFVDYQRFRNQSCKAKNIQEKFESQKMCKNKNLESSRSRKGSGNKYAFQTTDNYQDIVSNSFVFKSNNNIHINSFDNSGELINNINPIQLLKLLNIEKENSRKLVIINRRRKILK